MDNDGVLNKIEYRCFYMAEDCLHNNLADKTVAFNQFDTDEDEPLSFEEFTRGKNENNIIYFEYSITNLK